jgi:ELWxxDGT repeat protein
MRIPRSRRLVVAGAVALGATAFGWIPPGSPVVVLADGSLGPDIHTLMAVEDGLVFAAPSPRHGRELWHTDGTVKGTTVLKDIRPGRRGSLPSSIVDDGQVSIVGDTMYFPADDGRHGMELWRTDGTPDGTLLVKDIRPGRRGAWDHSRGPEPYIYSLPSVSVGETLYFFADDGEHAPSCGAPMARRTGRVS